MKLWIAAHEDADYCTIFLRKPNKQYSPFLKKSFYGLGYDEIYLNFPKEMFPEVTFENSPMEVELKIKTT